MTATMLADLVRCEMRVQLDLHGDPQERQPVNGFVEMLWRQGGRHEEAVIAALPGIVADLRGLPPEERGQATARAMAGDADWIAGARIRVGDLEGRPDLLHRIEGVWHAGDIKSGGAYEANGRDPRREYLAQVGFYGAVLGALGWGSGERAFVIGSDGELAWYDLGAPVRRGGETGVEFVQALLSRVRGLLDGSGGARPALCAACGLCVWRARCRDDLLASGDLTLVAGLGRSVREGLEPIAPDIGSLAGLDVEALARDRGRTSVPGLGAARLLLFRERARVLASGAAPFAVQPLGLSRRDLEFHLDLETDPTAEDFCYLHGVWRRRRTAGGDAGDFVHFLAEHPGEERAAFAAAVDFLSADPDALITTFSAFERTTYRRLAGRYPEVGAERVEALFAAGRCVDLYFDVILKATHWPLSSLGLKAVAKHLGFDWNDPEASGASSIGWFVEWQETRDPALLDRILTYNMNDCRASAVVMDGALALPVMPRLPWPVGVSAG